MADEERLHLALEDTASTGVRVAGVRILNYAIGFVASVVIARSLGPTGRGLYALPVAVLGIVLALSHVGIEQSNVYLRARGVELGRLWATSTSAALAVAVAAWVLVAAVGVVAGDAIAGDLPLAWFAVVLAQVPVLLLSLYWAGLLQLAGDLRRATAATLTGTFVHAVAIVGLAAAGALTPFRVLALTWVSAVATALALLRGGMRRGIVGGGTDGALLRRSLTFGLRAQLATVFTFLLLRVDQLLVGDVLGFRELGLYALAVVLAELLWLATDPFAASLLPHQVAATGSDDRRLAFATARLSLVVAAALAAVAWVTAPWLIRLAYGERFVEAASAFRWLLPGVIAFAAQRPLHAVVTKQGRMGLAAVLNATALAVNVALNLVLLDRIGIAGASVASSVTYGALGIAYVLATRERGVASWADLVPRGSDLRRLSGGFRRASRERRPGRPRAVLVIGTLERGGAEGQLALLAEGLVGRGWEVTVLCLSRSGPLEDRIRAAGAEVVVAGFRGFTPLLDPRPVVRALRTVRAEIERRDPDVVHTFLYWANLIGGTQARRAGVPVVIASLRSLWDAMGTSRWFGTWERRTYARADAITCNSEAVRADALAHGVRSERLVVVPNGVVLPPALGAPDPGVLLSVANLIPYKGHDVLLDALARVEADGRVLLAGTGPAEADLRARAARLGIEGRVEFLGSVTDVGPLLRRASFTVLPSRSEGFPNAVLESLAHGRAVVATAVGGTPEILGLGGGILVPPEDPAALAAAIERLLRDPDEARRLGEQGRAVVADRFGPARMVEATVALYVDRLERRGIRLDATVETAP
jgi:glycosyltransferase involved in cell wall biosynthesis/O-antigen/teichoic acid export membrane protein